jgi:diguanylate cyclase (GGDEF)-like protein
VTRPLPSDAAGPDDRPRVLVARKWAYLLCTTAYVPLVPGDLEEPLREMLDELFAAHDRVEVAERVGARLVDLHCVDRRSLQITVDVLAGPLCTARPDHAARLLGALAGGFAQRLRERTIEQQESMVRAVKAVTTKATQRARTAENQRDAMATELSLLRRQLSHQLLHDVHTGLPNKQFLTTRLEEVLNSGCPTSLYRLELNGFRTLNDGLGSRCADAMLVDLTTRLHVALDGEDAMIARLDRAGFAVLVEHRPESPRPATPPARIVARLTEAMAETTYVGDLGVAVTADIGVVQSPPYGTDHHQLLQAADLALRLAKEQGQWRLLTPSEGTADRRLLRLAAIMPGAVETGGLSVGYRSRVDLADRKPVAVDAYPRWADAGLSGRECLDLADRAGLSPQLSGWLLRAAGEWEVPLSVSLSPNQAAAPDLVDTVLDVPLAPARLQVALPAGEVFDGRPQAVDNLTALAKAGVSMAVHDFHGGPSEVVRLPDLPVRAVSLAPRLIAQARALGRRTLVRDAMSSLVALVHEAGATVSVDDVRTEPEVDWWRRAGADTASGPLFPLRVH